MLLQRVTVTRACCSWCFYELSCCLGQPSICSSQGFRPGRLQGGQCCSRHTLASGRVQPLCSSVLSVWVTDAEHLTATAGEAQNEKGLIISPAAEHQGQDSGGSQVREPCDLAAGA